jgi:glutathione synthase/RimK-type ligase-like ATP-grasp enzyme
MDILILVDYKGFFSSKQNSQYYRGGLNLKKIEKFLQKHYYHVEIISYSELNLNYKKITEEKPFIIYQSSEDKGNHYKSYIEDVIFDLEKRGLTVIPKFEYLRAHNNKVAMELLRQRSSFNNLSSIHSFIFGTLEEVLSFKKYLKYPLVLKSASGSMSKGVYLAKDFPSLKRYTKKLSSSKYLLHDVKDKLRTIKYGKRYKKESLNRKKFIAQNYIPGLNNDYKILVYGNKCFVLYRGVREGDFRASGSGNFHFKKNLPNGILDYAYLVKKSFDVPNISLDIAYDGKGFHLIEFQFIMFGTTTLEKSPFHFSLQPNGNWKIVEGKADLELIYAASIHEYLESYK